MNITFVTGNALKMEIAKRSLSTSDITLELQELDIPEIQSESVIEIASFSASWAANTLGKPVVVTDAGYFIPALNGFPGPFIKYINKWLTAEDILKLMKGKVDRSVLVKSSLAYCLPGGEPKVFNAEIYGTLALKVPLHGNENSTTINQIFIPHGHSKVASELSKNEEIEFWSKGETHWSELEEFLRT